MVARTPSGAVKTSARRAAQKAGHTMPGGCLSGDTLVETLDGLSPISHLVGCRALLTERGWIDAEVRDFGCQPLMEITISRGCQRQAILATPWHRWYTQRGIVITSGLREGDAFPKVMADHFDPNALKPPQPSIACIAEQASDTSSSMVMINLEGRPSSSRNDAISIDLRNLSADCTSAILGLKHDQEFIMPNAVFSAKGAIPALEPVFVTELDRSRSLGDTPPPAHLAFSAMPPSARIELGSRFDLMADAARYGFDAAAQWGNGASRHVSHYADRWCVEQVRETDLVESVYCAVVPHLCRFVIVGGVLTGNSFPINNAGDLAHAKHDIGRAKNPAAARRWVNKRAHELGEPGVGQKRGGKVGGCEVPHRHDRRARGG